MIFGATAFSSQSLISDPTQGARSDFQRFGLTFFEKQFLLFDSEQSVTELCIGNREPAHLNTALTVSRMRFMGAHAKECVSDRTFADKMPLTDQETGTLIHGRRVVPAPEFESGSRDPQSLRISWLPYAGSFRSRSGIKPQREPRNGLCSRRCGSSFWLWIHR